MKKLILLCLFVLFCHIKIFAQIISKDDELNLKQYIRTKSPEELVGQLLIVGIPGDINNYQNNPNIIKIIKEFGVGGVIVNGYNVRQYNNNDNKITIIQSIKSFIEHLQTISLTSNTKLPLFICADFESFEHSSVPQGLEQIPPALTLAATADTQIVSLMGHITGFQLRSIGVNILLGPVLDLYRSEQGNLIKILDNRCFGSSANGVYGISSYFLQGVKEEGIYTIGKHFPGMGCLNEDPHYSLPMFTGSVKKLNEELFPYRNLSEFLDGYMTAHMKIGILDPSNKPVTFSRKMVTKLIREEDSVAFVNGERVEALNKSEKIIVTDDLSGMYSIDKYMKENNLTFGDIAIEAFNAGHDLLMFSHIELPNLPSRSMTGKFTINDLAEVKNKLLAYVKSSDDNLKHLRESVFRILKLKLLYNIRMKINKGFPYYINEVWSVKNSSSTDVLEQIDKQGGLRSFLQLTYDKATILLNKNCDYVLTESQNSSVLFAINENNINAFEKEFTFNKPKFSFYKIKNVLKATELKAIEEQLLVIMNKYDKLIISVNNLNEANIVDYLRLKNEIEFSKKVIVLIHQNPAVLKKEVLLKATVFGNFARDSMAYNSDVKVLKGVFKPFSINNLPINLENFHNVQISTTIKPAKGFAQNILFETENERNLNNEKKHLIYENETILLSLWIFVSVLLIISGVSIANTETIKVLLKDKHLLTYFSVRSFYWTFHLEFIAAYIYYLISLKEPIFYLSLFFLGVPFLFQANKNVRQYYLENKSKINVLNLKSFLLSVGFLIAIMKDYGFIQFIVLLLMLIEKKLITISQIENILKKIL